MDGFFNKKIKRRLVKLKLINKVEEENYTENMLLVRLSEMIEILNEYYNS